MTIQTTAVAAGKSVVQPILTQNQAVTVTPGASGSIVLEFTTQKNPRLSHPEKIIWSSWPFGLVTAKKQGLLLPQVSAIRVTALASAGSFTLQDESIGVWAPEALGQNELERVKLYAITTSGSTQVLSKDGATPNAANCMYIPADSTYAFDALIVARRTDALDESAMYRQTGAIDRGTNANTTALVGSVTAVDVAEDNAGWDVVASADTTLGALVFTVTGEALKTVAWVARVSLVEITG